MTPGLNTPTTSRSGLEGRTIAGVRMGLAGARMTTHSNPSARSVLGLRSAAAQHLQSFPLRHISSSRGAVRGGSCRLAAPPAPRANALVTEVRSGGRRGAPLGATRLCAAAVSVRPAGSRQVHGAMRPGRCVSSKNGLQAFRSAEAQIRHCRSEFPAAQLIPVRRSDNPSRSRRRKARAGRPFFRPSGRAAPRT